MFSVFLLAKENHCVLAKGKYTFSGSMKISWKLRSKKLQQRAESLQGRRGQSSVLSCGATDGTCKHHTAHSWNHTGQKMRDFKLYLENRWKPMFFEEESIIICMRVGLFSFFLLFFTEVSKHYVMIFQIGMLSHVVKITEIKPCEYAIGDTL